MLLQNILYRISSKLCPLQLTMLSRSDHMILSKTTILFSTIFFISLLSGCAEKIQTIDAEIMTQPPGATIFIDDHESPDVTPFNHVFDFKNKKEYKLLIKKEGYFQKEFTVSEQLASLDEGQVRIKLAPSPLWEATTSSPTTNNWVQVLVGEGLDSKAAWQIMVDAVIKRSVSVKELNYEAGYLQTKYTIKKFDTVNGEFLLRCQMIATLVSTDPLIYRIKDVAEWSGNGVNWFLYNRILKEHASMLQEIEDRLRSN